VSVGPPSLRWVALFMESMNRALDDEIYSWDLRERADPLSWVLVITLKRKILSQEARILREQLSLWAEVNDAKYQRSTWEKYQFKALLLIKGLGPVQQTNPHEEDIDFAVFRSGRSGLWGARRTNARSRLYPSDRPAPSQGTDRLLADVLGQGFEDDDSPAEGEIED
jgi:hypothetical protein